MEYYSHQITPANKFKKFKNNSQALYNQWGITVNANIVIPNTRVVLSDLEFFFWKAKIIYIIEGKVPEVLQDTKNKIL